MHRYMCIYIYIKTYVHILRLDGGKQLYKHTLAKKKHLLDTIYFWYGREVLQIQIYPLNRYSFCVLPYAAMGRPLCSGLIKQYADSFNKFPVLKTRGFSILVNTSGKLFLNKKPSLKDVDANTEDCYGKKCLVWIYVVGCVFGIANK